MQDAEAGSSKDGRKDLEVRSKTGRECAKDAFNASLSGRRYTQVLTLVTATNDREMGTTERSRIARNFKKKAAPKARVERSQPPAGQKYGKGGQEEMET